MIRVPATAFEETLDAPGGIGRVVERTVSGEDVSEQYYDLNIRLSCGTDPVPVVASGHVRRR